MDSGQQELITTAAIEIIFCSSTQPPYPALAPNPKTKTKTKRLKYKCSQIIWKVLIL